MPTTTKTPKPLPGTSKTTRLRKLVCAERCGYPPLRVSRAAIRVGLPTCVCGAMLWPWDLDDLALAVEHGHMSDAQYDAHPLAIEYREQEARVLRGQYGHKGKLSSQLRPSGEIAMRRVAELVVADARENQLRAARALRVAVDAADPIPF